MILTIILHRALAEAAIVVEELDEGDVAVGIADHHVFGGIENRFPVVLNRSKGPIFELLHPAWLAKPAALPR
jgi:hypothetical protein